MPRGSHTGALIPEEKLTRFLTAYVNCGFNAVEAGLGIGMSKRSVQANSHRYVATIRNRLSLQQALAGAGLDPMTIVESSRSSLIATGRNGIQRIFA
jgi:hypothetical protein